MPGSDLSLIWALFGPRIHYLSRPLEGAGLAFGEACSLDVLERLAKSLAPWHVWFCLNPSYSKRPKPTKEEIHRVDWLVIDQDLDTPEAAASLTALTDSLGVNSLLVHTGRGRQAWLRVASTGDTFLDDAIIKGLTKHWQTELPGIDSSCAEISRIVRLPGTTNPKNGRLCRIERFVEEQGLLALADFKTLAISAPAPAASGGREALTGGLELSLLGVTAWNTWLLGPAVGSRHKELWHLTKSCREIGLDRERSEAVLYEANDKCEKPLGERDLQQLLRQTFST